MTDIEKRILKNHTEIMWALCYLLRCAKPNLVGRGGELDRMCSDLTYASKDTDRLIAAAA